MANIDIETSCWGKFPYGTHNITQQQKNNNVHFLLAFTCSKYFKPMLLIFKDHTFLVANAIAFQLAVSGACNDFLVKEETVVYFVQRSIICKDSEACFQI